MAEDRTERVGTNEAVFRLVNEEIQGLNGEILRSAPTGSMEIFCECSRIACVERLSVSITTYERVRGSALRFVVTPGHELPDIERVVENTDSYYVVEKDPASDAGKAAIETDPRS